MSEQKTIQVKVSRTVYPKESFSDGRSRFCIVLTDKGAAKGMVPFYPEPGMKLKLTGAWTVYHGSAEFRFNRVSQDVPQDPKALLDYVCKIGKGLGPKTAEKVWASHGSDWQSHIEEFNPSTALSIRRTLDALGANKAKTDLVLFCLKIGGSPSMADKAWAAWGENAVATITANPFLLATLPGIGFRTADTVRGYFGIGDKDMRRASAAIDFSMSDLMEQGGNSIVKRDELYAHLRELNVDRSIAAVCVAKAVADGRIVFVGLDELTTNRVVDDEGDLARYAVENTGTTDVTCVWGSFQPDQAQVDAVHGALSRLGLTVINGAAGVGKTTIIKVIADSLRANGDRPLLCAFAGKAAARLREATGHDASTIHSMLGWMGDGAGFTCGTLEGDSVILDEASMVPSSLLHEITKRNPKRLILVGDHAQLQPVGVGSPFHDIIDILPTVVHTLATCYRNKEAVFSSAMKIRNGEAPTDATSAHEVFDITTVKNPEDAHALVVELVKSGKIDFAQDLVLSPRNGDGEEPAPCTVKSVNDDAQSIVNPHDAGQKFKVDDRVMCVKNFPKLNIWNGTCGWISRVDEDGIPYMAPDDGDEVRLGEKEQRERIVPAYCLTVHKSQGSQYRDVYAIVLKRDGAVLMDRSMLYTAVTRARHACHIICDAPLDKVINAIRRRRTYLQHLLNGNI